MRRAPKWISWPVSACRLAYRPASVDKKHLGSDEASIVRPQEFDGGREFLRPSEAIHRDVRQEIPFGFAAGARVLTEHFALDRPSATALTVMPPCAGLVGHMRVKLIIATFAPA